LIFKGVATIFNPYKTDVASEGYHLMNIRFLIRFMAFLVLGGALGSAMDSSAKSSNLVDLTKIESGFFISEQDVDGLQDQVFREELTGFLKEEGIITKSSRGFLYYYVSETQIDQIENPEFRERVRQWVKEREERMVSPKRAEHTVHEVQSGETLWHIAQRYGMSVDELVRLNRLTPAEPIHPGQKLVVSPDWR